MDAKELMIGDWIFLKNGKVLQTCQVTVIGNATQNRNNIGKYVCLDTSDEFPTCIFEIDKISPIPLTAEIFKKIGFADGKYRHYIGCIWKLNVEGFRILNLTESCGKSCLWGEKIKPNSPNSVGNEFAIPNICYVHQLQQAMRLLGIEKEIKL